MGLVQDVKEKFSFQNAAITVTFGALTGAATSRFVEVISPAGGALIGAACGSTGYFGQLLSGEKATPMRSIIATVLVISITSFALMKGGEIFASHLGYAIIPTTLKGFIPIATTNVFGCALMIYFPILFPSFRTAPSLPTTLKDLYEMPASKVHACHYYYEGNQEAFDNLRPFVKYGLSQSFRKCNLPALTKGPYTFDGWDKDALTFVEYHKLPIGTSEEVFSFQQCCYAAGMDPPQTVTPNFSLPRTIAEISQLTPKKMLWFTRLFAQHPTKWESLSPAFQLAFLRISEHFEGLVKTPTSIEEVQELSDEDLLSFHDSFDTGFYEDEQVLLALIQRFGKQSLPLPKGYESKLQQLPPPLAESQVTDFTSLELTLYETLYHQNAQLWKTLDKKVQWAFSIKEGYDWPDPVIPDLCDIVTLKEEYIRFYYQNNRFDLFTNPETQYVLIRRFFEYNLPPNLAMIDVCMNYAHKEDIFPLKDHLSVTDIENLKPNQLLWFASIFRHYRGVWINQSLKAQVAFKKRKPYFDFLGYTYPTTETAANIDEQTAIALQKEFDIDIMRSKGPNPLRKLGTIFPLIPPPISTHPLDDQSPELFALSPTKRETILRKLGAKFSPSNMPKGMEPYTIPPKTPDAISSLDTSTADYWAHHYSQFPDEWEKLSIHLQIAFRKRPGPKKYQYPPLTIKKKEDTLRSIAIEGNHKQSTGIDNLNNPEYQILIFIHRDTDIFELDKWITLNRQTQEILIAAFENIPEINPLLPGSGHSIPPHPNGTDLNFNLDPSILRAYHQNFHPAVFHASGDTLSPILDRFRTLFTPMNLIGPIQKHLESLSDLTPEDILWARKIFTNQNGVVPPTADPQGLAAWDSLSLGTQIIYQKACKNVDGGIPTTYIVKSPTLNEAKSTLNNEQVKLFHAYYSQNQNIPTWIRLEPPIQATLGLRFKKLEKKELDNPWYLTQEKANQITQDSEEALAYRDYYTTNRKAWQCLDLQTQQVIMHKTPDDGHRLPPLQQDWKTLQWNRYHYGHNRTFNLENTSYAIAAVALFSFVWFSGYTPLITSAASLLGRAICIVPYTCSANE